MDLTLIETERGTDEEGDPVVCYEVRRGEVVVARLQSTPSDVHLWAGINPSNGTSVDAETGLIQ